MVVEGVDELMLALQAGLKPQMLLTAPELAARIVSVENSEITTVSRSVFSRISYRENPDGWLGVFPIPDISLDAIHLSTMPIVIVAESVEKPGNLGAILRTADATHVDALLVCDPRVDIWNPNVIRASRGAVFTVPTMELDNPSALSWLRSNDLRVIAATPEGQADYVGVRLTMPLAIVVGTEDAGLSMFWKESADQTVRIPMKGVVNSLNVSIAAALITYEAIRQRTVSDSQ